MQHYSHFEHRLAKLITAFRHAEHDEHRIHEHRALQQACLGYLKHPAYQGRATDDDCHEAFHQAHNDALSHILTLDVPAEDAAHVLKEALEHHRSKWKKIRKNETSFVVKTDKSGGEHVEHEPCVPSEEGFVTEFDHWTAVAKAIDPFLDTALTLLRDENEREHDLLAHHYPGLHEPVHNPEHVHYSQRSAYNRALRGARSHLNRILERLTAFIIAHHVAHVDETTLKEALRAIQGHHFLKVINSVEEFGERRVRGK